MTVNNNKYLKKYCKVINEETKELSVGLGTNIDFYKSLGYEEREIIEVNNRYYLKGYEPATDIKQTKKLKKQEIRMEVEAKFYSIYPIYKQCNIAIFGTEEEKQKFKEFHDNIVAEYDRQLEQLGLSLLD